MWLVNGQRWAVRAGQCALGSAAVRRYLGSVDIGRLILFVRPLITKYLFKVTF